MEFQSLIVSEDRFLRLSHFEHLLLELFVAHGWPFVLPVEDSAVLLVQIDCSWLEWSTE